MKRYVSGLFGFACAVFSANPALSDTDPAFSRAELNEIVSILVESGRLDRSSRIARTSVVTPPKNGAQFRRGRVTILDSSGTHEAEVDLKQNIVTRWSPVEKGRAPVLSAEWARASAALKSDKRWQQAMAKRGYFRFDDIFCEALSAGYFPDRASAQRRVLRLPCYDISDATPLIYGRPIEGLIATVDAQTGEVIELLDEGVIPVPAPVPQPCCRRPPRPALPGQRKKGQQQLIPLRALSASCMNH